MCYTRCRFTKTKQKGKKVVRLFAEPKYDYSKLRGRIKEKCGTEGAFAKKIRRSHNYLTSVFQGKSYFSQKDIGRGAEVLEIAPVEIGEYFFIKKVHKNETRR